MPRPAPDPLTGATRLLIDGTNLLHALARRGGPLPTVAVTGRLRALVPPGVAVTLVLDGGPAPGGADRRLTSGIDVRYSGRRSADALLGDLVAAAPDGTLVVTDDIALGDEPAGGRSAHGAHLVAGGAALAAEARGAGRGTPEATPRSAARRTRRRRRGRRAALEARSGRDEEDRQPEARAPPGLTSRSRRPTPCRPAERPYRSSHDMARYGPASPRP